MNLTTDISWVKAHLVLLALTVAIAFASVYGVESLVAKHDAANDAKWSSLLSDVKASNAQAIANLTAQNNALLQQISTRNKQLVVVQTQDKQLPAPQIAQKLGGTAPDATTVALPLDTARTITAELESIPVLQANVAAETTIATDDTKEIADLQTQLQVSDKACQAQITDIKAKARKSKLKWFAAGFISGVTLGLIH